MLQVLFYRYLPIGATARLLPDATYGRWWKEFLPALLVVESSSCVCIHAIEGEPLVTVAQNVKFEGPAGEFGFIGAQNLRVHQESVNLSLFKPENQAVQRLHWDAKDLDGLRQRIIDVIQSREGQEAVFETIR
jgi:hypothetical protein